MVISSSDSKRREKDWKKRRNKNWKRRRGGRDWRRRKMQSNTMPRRKKWKSS